MSGLYGESYAFWCMKWSVYWAAQLHDMNSHIPWHPIWAWWAISAWWHCAGSSIFHSDGVRSHEHVKVAMLHGNNSNAGNFWWMGSTSHAGLSSSIRRLRRWWIGEHSLDIEGTGEIKYPGWTWKLTYDRLPRGNQDLGQSGNCKWEAALAKLTRGGDEVISTALDQKPTDEYRSHCISYRTLMWKERRNHHIMISKQQPKYYDESIQ